jgi:hypothetical protein
MQSTPKYLIILSRTHSGHASEKAARAALKEIKLRKGEVGVIITPKGERKHERQTGK